MPTSTHATLETDRIRPIPGAWERAKRVRGLKTTVALAKAMGVSEPTLWRVLVAQEQEPGEEFIKKALSFFWSTDEEKHFGFYDLFDGPWGQ